MITKQELQDAIMQGRGYLRLQQEFDLTQPALQRLLQQYWGITRLSEVRTLIGAPGPSSKFGGRPYVTQGFRYATA